MPGGLQEGQGKDCAPLKGDGGEGAEQLHFPAAHHTLASTRRAGRLQRWQAARTPRAFLPPSLWNPGLCEGKCKSAPLSMLSVEGGSSLCAPDSLPSCLPEC